MPLRIANLTRIPRKAQGPGTGAVSNGTTTKGLANLTRIPAFDSLPIHEKTTMSHNPIVIPVSRRDFARHVAVAATALALPEAVLSQATPGSAPAASQPGTPPDVPKEVAEEVETKFNNILRLSVPGAAGSFTAEQKDEIRRQLVSQVQGLQKLRAYELDNGDAPATVLRLTAGLVAGEAK